MMKKLEILLMNKMERVVEKIKLFKSYKFIGLSQGGRLKCNTINLINCIALKAKEKRLLHL